MRGNGRSYSKNFLPFNRLTFPYYIPVGSSRMPLHSVTEFLAFFAGFRYFIWLQKRKKDVIPSQQRTWIVIASLFGALFGSRLLGGLENPPELVSSGNIFLYFYQNKTVLGGFLGGLLAVEITKKIIGERRASGDLFVYPIMLALIIGRTGCFSMGIYEETYGLPTTLPWGMFLGDAFPRHPVALYEIVFLILLWAGIAGYERYGLLENGMRFKLFLIAYLVFRFFLDFIKPHYPVAAGLSSIQLACLAGLIYYLYLLGGRMVFPAQKNA